MGMVACMYFIHHVCLLPLKPEKGTRSLGIRATSSYKPVCGYQELELDPLQVFMFINT